MGEGGESDRESERATERGDHAQKVVAGEGGGAVCITAIAYPPTNVQSVSPVIRGRRLRGPPLSPPDLSIYLYIYIYIYIYMYVYVYIHIYIFSPAGARQAPLPLLSPPQSLDPAPCTLNPSPYTLNRRGGTDSHDTAHGRDQPLETRLAQPLGFRQQQERVHLRRKVDVRLPVK